MGYLWKCKQLEIEEMAVCLSLGPGQVGSWIKAFQQIVSIISPLPLPTFFTIHLFLLGVSLHLVVAPTVARFLFILHVKTGDFDFLQIPVE